MPSNQRGEERKHHCVVIEIGLKSEEVKTIRGITMNISDSGLGIYSITPFIDGQEVFANVGSPDQRELKRPARDRSHAARAGRNPFRERERGRKHGHSGSRSQTTAKSRERKMRNELNQCLTVPKMRSRAKCRGNRKAAENLGIPVPVPKSAPYGG